MFLFVCCPCYAVNPFTTNEIKCAIKKLKNNKSAGCDKIRSEHLKNAPHALIQEITDLLNNTTETGNYPKELKIGHLTPIYKPGKPKVIMFMNKQKILFSR